jgi:ubiquinone/menaquinone biosynthesis C-methylase UbiE
MSAEGTEDTRDRRDDPFQGDEMSHSKRASFKMITFIHETLYGLFRDPGKALRAAGLARGLSVLEVGCGPGFFTLPAARMVGETGILVTLDINPLAVQRAARKITKAKLAHVRVLLADATRTGLAARSFDLVFLFGMPRPIGGRGEMFAELHRLLKTEGVLSVEGRLKPPEDLFIPVTRIGRISRFRRADQARS